MIAKLCLSLLGLYLVAGLLFAIPFVLIGAKRIDPHAVHGSWGFRLLILPGSALLWPILLKRWLSGLNTPPEELNAHRLAAKNGARP